MKNGADHILEIAELCFLAMHTVNMEVESSCVNADSIKVMFDESKSSLCENLISRSTSYPSNHNNNNLWYQNLTTGCPICIFLIPSSTFEIY